MKITLLGTGTSQGVPVIGCNCKVCCSENKKDNRLRSSLLVQWDKYNYVIDTGPDFRLQMLRQNINHINGIFYTHEHADHTAGFDDIRPLYFKNKKPIPIYTKQRVIDDLKKRFDYVFTKVNRYPGAPEVATFIPKPYRTYYIGGVEVTALEILHGKLPIYAYKFGNMAYITDAKTIPDKSIELLKDIPLLIINSLHHKQHKMHLSLKESLAIIDKINPKRAILTHISHNMGLYNDINSSLPQAVELGYDNMEIYL